MIHIETLILAHILNTGFFSLIALLSYRQTQHSGAQLWGFALAAQAAGWLVFVLRGLMPVAFLVVGSNFLFYLALLFHLMALEQYFDRDLRVWPYVLAILGLMAVLLFYTGVQPDFSIRLAIFAFSATLLVGRILWALRSIRPSIGVIITVLGFTIYGLTLLYQGVLAIAYPEIAATLFEPGGPQELIGALLFFSHLMFALGFMLMLNEYLMGNMRLMATLDPLTQCYNRRVIYDLAEKEISYARRYGTQVSVLVMDIDNFKRLNDNYGHAVGDLALQTVANLLKETLRRQDALGRIGGEEFIALLPNTTQGNAFKAAERVRVAVENLTITHEDISISITISIGVAELLPDETKVEQLVHRADLAMYTAKKAGRNRTMRAAATGPLALPAEK